VERELRVNDSRACGKLRYPHGGEHFALLETDLVRADDEVRDRSPTGGTAPASMLDVGVQREQERRRVGVRVGEAEVAAERAGFVAAIDTEMLGTAAMVLGAGREKVEDVIDPGAGLVVHGKLGDEVGKGEPLVTLHYNDPSRLLEAEAMVKKAYSVSDPPRPSVPELILAVLEQ